MENTLHRIETSTRGQGLGEDVPWRESPRVRLFAITAAIVLFVGLIYILLQPAHYHSSATVLMSAPTAIDASAAEADIQNVAIQRRILLGADIIGRTLEKISQDNAQSLNEEHLKNLLGVNPVPNTNLVEMAAEGSDPELLPRLISAWINVYVEARAEDIEQSKNQTTRLVEDELEELAIKLEEARTALDDFREANNIISAERQENEVLSRLDGLNKALNNAIEAEVQAGAHLETVRDAIRRGEKVVPVKDKQSLQRLESELESLEAQHSETRNRYTEEYIRKQPKLREVAERIEVLKKEIGNLLLQYQDSELTAVQQAHTTARQTVWELERQLAEQQAKVAEFSTLFLTHQALVSDLQRLEELNRETQARLVRVEVRRVEKYPQVSVIDGPPTRAERIGPNYPLLIAYTLGTALVAGVLVVWLHGFLGHKSTEPAYITLSGVHMYPDNRAGDLAAASTAESQLTGDTRTMLEQQPEDPDKSDRERDT